MTVNSLSVRLIQSAIMLSVEIRIFEKAVQANLVALVDDPKYPDSHIRAKFIPYY